MGSLAAIAVILSLSASASVIDGSEDIDVFYENCESGMETHQMLNFIDELSLEWEQHMITAPQLLEKVYSQCNADFHDETYKKRSSHQDIDKFLSKLRNRVAQGLSVNGDAHDKKRSALEKRSAAAGSRDKRHHVHRNHKKPDKRHSNHERESDEMSLAKRHDKRLIKRPVAGNSFDMLADDHDSELYDDGWLFRKRILAKRPLAGNVFDMDDDDNDLYDDEWQSSGGKRREMPIRRWFKRSGDDYSDSDESSDEDGRRKKEYTIDEKRMYGRGRDYEVKRAHAHSDDHKRNDVFKEKRGHGHSHDHKRNGDYQEKRAHGHSNDHDKRAHGHSNDHDKRAHGHSDDHDKRAHGHSDNHKKRNDDHDDEKKHSALGKKSVTDLRAKKPAARVRRYAFIPLYKRRYGNEMSWDYKRLADKRRYGNGQSWDYKRSNIEKKLYGNGEGWDWSKRSWRDWPSKRMYGNGQGWDYDKRAYGYGTADRWMGSKMLGHDKRLYGNGQGWDYEKRNRGGSMVDRWVGTNMQDHSERKKRDAEVVAAKKSVAKKSVDSEDEDSVEKRLYSRYRYRNKPKTEKRYYYPQIRRSEDDSESRERTYQTYGKRGQQVKKSDDSSEETDKRYAVIKKSQVSSEEKRGFESSEEKNQKRDADHANTWWQRPNRADDRFYYATDDSGDVEKRHLSRGSSRKHREGHYSYKKSDDENYGYWARKRANEDSSESLEDSNN